MLKPLSAAEGAHARDALCKAIYGRMFSWIVGKINSSIKVLGKGHTFFMSSRLGTRYVIMLGLGTLFDSCWGWELNMWFM